MRASKSETSEIAFDCANGNLMRSYPPLVLLMKSAYCFISLSSSQSFFHLISHMSDPVYNRYQPFSNRLNNRFHNRLNVCLHDATGWTTGCTTVIVQPSTGWTTGCIVSTNIQPVVTPVMQPVVQLLWQPVVSCKRGIRPPCLWPFSLPSFH